MEIGVRLVAALRRRPGAIPPRRSGIGIRAALSSTVLLLLALPVSGRATVYSWTAPDGTLHFSNLAEDVPDGVQPEKSPRRPAPAVAQESPPPVGGQPDAADSPQAPAAQGVPSPTRLADRAERPAAAGPATLGGPPPLAHAQIPSRGPATESGRGAAARRLFEQAIEKGPPPKPSFHVSRLRDRGPVRGVGYGLIGPGRCPVCGATYGFRRMIPHSHFHPTPENLTRSRLFFPDGHQNHRGYIVGHGYYAW